MREGFETLVEKYFQNDPSAQKELNNILSQSFNKLSLKLKDDEIAYLAQQSESAENHAASNYIKGCLSHLEENYSEAIRLYDLAIELGNANAMYRRAWMHQNGLGGDIFKYKATRLYDLAIELGNTGAMNARAYMHENCEYGDLRYSKAIRLYEMAIELGDANAMSNRALMYEQANDGYVVNYPKVIRLYDRAIALGNTSAMANRAYMHEHGLGGTVNYSKAIKLYDRAIELGFAYAMFNRALMHYNGHGGAVNYPEAARLYNRAITFESAGAMNNRAYMDEHCADISVFAMSHEQRWTDRCHNELKAIQLYDMAIQFGHSDAMVNRAHIHWINRDNDSKIIRLYDRAIELGNAYAMFKRALMHQHGHGGAVNCSKAIKLYDKAIELGNANAMYRRATMHYNGHGGAVNYPEAARLYRQASRPSSLEQLKKAPRLYRLYTQSSHPEALQQLKAIETSTYLWFALSRQEYQTVIYHCAAADKSLAPFLTKNPTAIDIFLKDDLLKKEERDAILTTLDEQFFLPNIACFTQSIIDTLNSLKEASLKEASIDLPSFATLQDKSPFTIEEKHLSPLIAHLSANLTQIGVDDACAVLTQEYQRLPSTRATAVVSLENQNPSVALTNTSSLATRDELPSNANVSTSSTWRLPQNPLEYLWANNKSTIFQTDRNTKETELMPLVSKGPTHTYGATED